MTALTGERRRCRMGAIVSVRKWQVALAFKAEDNFEPEEYEEYMEYFEDADPPSNAEIE
jgi:hypothetical protein